MDLVNKSKELLVDLKFLENEREITGASGAEDFASHVMSD
jgi:hypothetical protein